MAGGRDDTVVAVITPPGEGGVAGIRLAGPRSRSLAGKLFSPRSGRQLLPAFKLQYGSFRAADGSLIDEVTAVYMPSGRSYTGLSQVEIFCHGGRRIVQRIIDELVACGARAAEPGEFTRLAFLNGRIDLTRAEAVAEMVAAATDSALDVARDHLTGAYSEHVDVLRSRMVALLGEIEALIDFPEEDLPLAVRGELERSLKEVIGAVDELKRSYRGGRIIREGFRIAICGRPNAGKSSLFNLLLHRQRALVTSTPGTTRDYLSEWIDLGGFAVNIVDTAGLRRGGGTIERAGQRSTRELIAQAHLVLWLIDVAQQSWPRHVSEDRKQVRDTPSIWVANKIDLIEDHQGLKGSLQLAGIGEPALLSCKTRRGLKGLINRLGTHISENVPDLTSGAVVTSARHHQKLNLALKGLCAAYRKLKQGESPELTAFDLRQAVNQIDEITGKIYTDDILDHIFSKFCIGK
jgi:tRNA modification GTPase